MNKIEQHSMLISQLLILIVVVLTALPILQRPRLEDDDYRYLHLIQQMDEGNMGAIEAMTVENRWDHLWFLNEDGRIRFFRPAVVMSYALDYKLWGDDYARGLTLSNICIHLMCCLLVGFILLRILGNGLPAIVSGVLFAGLATHAECIWYIAGRTDTLAALGFLGAVALHLAGRRWMALPFYVFGLLTKVPVLAAPLVIAVYDVWMDRRRIDWKLFSTYGGLTILVLALKKLALGGEGSDWVYPYLINPFSEDYFGHLWLQFRSYTGNLVAAEETMPFADARAVSMNHRQIIPVAALLCSLTAAWFLRKDRRFWWLVLLGVLTWLPTSFVYLSERYLYLPSVAYVGLIGLAVAAMPRRWHTMLSLLLLAYAAFHTLELRDRHKVYARRSGSVAEMLGQLEPVHTCIENADRLLLVNFPGYFVRAQFAQEIFRVAFKRPDLHVDVLTMMPGQNGTMWKEGDAWPVMGAGVQLIQNDTRHLILSGQPPAAGQPPHTIQEMDTLAFNWAPLKSGGRFSTVGLEAHILDSTPVGATRIAFRFDQPIEGGVVLTWIADYSDLNEHPWIRRKKAVVKAEKL